MALNYLGAVIGAGRMGASTSQSVLQHAPPCWFPLSHLDAMGEHPRINIEAICDSDPRRLEHAAVKYGPSRTFNDYRTMLSEIRLEMLGVATRTPGRCAIILDAIKSGIRALHVEKPLCNSVAELTCLEKELAAHPIFMTYGAIRRHFSIYQSARALAHSGALGSVREVRVKFGHASLYWTHPHSVDLLLFAAGSCKVLAVQAHLSNITTGVRGNMITSDPVIEHAAIFFDDGTVGHITRAPGSSLSISCSRGEVAVEADGRDLFVLAPDGAGPYISRSAQRNTERSCIGGTLAALSQLVECLDGQEPARAANTIVKHDIILGQRILFAFVQSQIEGSRPVSLSEVDPALQVMAVADGYPA